MIHVWRVTLRAPQGDEQRTRPVLTVNHDLAEVQAAVEALLLDESKYKRFVAVDYLGEAEGV